LKILNNIFQLIENRLSQQELIISTMRRNTTIGERQTLGVSSPANKEEGIKKREDVLSDKWLGAINEQKDFGGTVAMRLEASYMVTNTYDETLLHTLIHELSHATAATHDFAYIHEAAYDKLDWVERLGNADTIALIAMELVKATASPTTYPANNMSQSSSSDEQTEKKEAEAKSLTLNDKASIKQSILTLSAKIKQDDILKLEITNLLKGYQITWEAIEDQFSFDIGEEQRVIFAMI
jgi:hypothetical protein